MRFQDELKTLLTQSRSGSQQWLFKPLRAQAAVRGFVFSGEESTLGSNPQCQLRINVAGVAGRHCRLLDDEGRLLIVAQDSRTWVNDGPVRKAHLRDGDRLTIGPVTFQVEMIAPAAEPENSAEVDLPLRDSRLVQSLNRAYDQGRLAGSPPAEMIPPPHVIAGTRPDSDETAVDELHRSLKATQEQLRRQQEQIARLEQQPEPEISELKREIQAVEANKQQQALAAERDKLQAERKRFEAERDALAGQFEKWLRIKRKWNQRWTGQRTSVQTEADRLAALNGELQEKADELLQREHELARSAAEREQTQARIQELNGRAAELENMLAAAQSAEQETEQRVQELEVQLRLAAEDDSLAAELEAQCERLNERVQGLETQLRQTEQQCGELQQQLTERDDRLASEAERLEELEASAKSIRTELADCQQQLTGRNEELGLRYEELTELRSLLDVAEADKQALSEQCQALEQQALAENDQRQAELDAEWTRMSEERDRLLELREQLTEQRAAFTQAHEDLRSVRSELEQEKGRFQEQQEEWAAETLRQRIVEARPVEAEQNIDEVPVDEVPVDEVPVDEKPVDEKPVDEKPVDEVPVDEAAAEDTLQSQVTETLADSTGVESEVDDLTSERNEDANIPQEEFASEETIEQDMIAHASTAPSLEEIDAEETDAEEIDGGADWSEFSFAEPFASEEANVDDTLESEQVPADAANAAEQTDAEVEEEPLDTAFQFSELRNALMQQEATETASSEIEPVETQALSSGTELDVAEQSTVAELAEDSAETEGAGDEFSSLRRELAEMFGMPSDKTSEANAETKEEDAASSGMFDEDQSSDDAERLADFAEAKAPDEPYRSHTDEPHTDEPSTEAAYGEEMSAEDVSPAENEITSLLDTSAFREDMNESLLSSPMESSQVDSTVAEETAPQAESASTPATAEPGDVVVDDIEDAESVAAYMKRLFARTSGNQDYTEPAVPAPAAKPAEPVARHPQGNASDARAEQGVSPAVVDGNMSSTPAEQKRPVAQVDREQLKQDIASLRDVANQTARHALATHAWKQVKLKMMMSGALTAASAIASVALLSSPSWSPVSHQSYGWLTLVLTAISGYELFRSHRGLVRLKQGPATLARSEVSPQPQPLPTEADSES